MIIGAQLKKMARFLAYTGLILAPALALATTSNNPAANNSLGGISANIMGSFAQVVQLITAISYVAGMGFALAGIMKFKSHRDNPQQVPLSAPIVLVVVATALLFMPAILSTAGATVFGSAYSGKAGSASSGFTKIQ